jgi:flagellar protein FlaG
MASTDPVSIRPGPGISRAGEAASSSGAVDSAASPAVTAPKAQPVRAVTPVVESISPEELNQKLEEIVQSLNEQLAETGRNLGFSIDKAINRQVVTVTNRDTGEIVRQIPSEVVIRVAHNIEELKGVLFDKEI